jgi:hypothetical protein
MSPSSPWNTTIPLNTTWYGNPNDTSKHTLWNVPGSGRRKWYCNTGFDWSCGVWFVKPTDPVWTFTLIHDIRGHKAGPLQLRAPDNLTVSSTGDNPAALVIDGELWDLYGVVITSRANHTANLYSYGHQPLGSGTGFGTPGQMWNNGAWNIDPCTGTRAANTPWGVGLITADDLKAPEILHALAVATPNSVTAPRGVAPCTSFDNNCWGALPSGTRIGIPANVAMPAALKDPRWNGLGMKFWKVWQTYGGYIVDTADPTNVCIYSDPVSLPQGKAIEPLFAWWSSPYTDPAGTKMSIMDLISPHLRVNQPH